ncbi:MAG: hypothetical protein LBG82_08000 [Clostridiales Family XIII bacterium]|jgi:hypothetical protein|nr:hypothetical protein [Clostridiales Family XIII bacterium]
MSEHNAVYFSMPEEEVYPLAEKFFLRAAGFDLEREKHRRMYEEAKDIRVDGLEKICVEGRYAVYGADAYDGEAICAGGERIPAAAFSRIPAEAVNHVALYVITARECGIQDDADIMAQLYAHMWGTAYVDAGRIMLETQLKEKLYSAARSVGVDSPALSPAFSPGFYGMDNKDNSAIITLLGAGDIGVSCLDTGVMLPVKTCSGVFLVTDGSTEFPGDECLVCIGNKTSCAECMIGNRAAMNI